MINNFPSVTIDAGVLAVPDVDCATEDAFQYVSKLLEWKKLIDEPWVALYISDRASESLFSDELYPLRHHLKELFNAHGIVEYDANTVATIANRLLAIHPSFETYYRVKDVLSEHFETDPDIISLTTHDGLQSELAHCITLIAVLRKHCAQPHGSHSLILREAPKQIIRVRAQIHDIEHSRDDIPVLPSPPETFEGDVLVCDDFCGLIKCLDESAIMVGASDDQGVALAIRIALFKYHISQGNDPNWTDMTVPSIGSKFRERCQQVCTDQGDSLPPKILRSIVETIEGLNLQAVHALRAGSSGSEPQRMRGSDKAQRRDIDRTFHLHFWQAGDGKVELASVVYHDDFSIPK